MSVHWGYYVPVHRHAHSSRWLKFQVLRQRFPDREPAPCVGQRTRSAYFSLRPLMRRATAFIWSWVSSGRTLWRPANS